MGNPTAFDLNRRQPLEPLHEVLVTLRQDRPWLGGTPRQQLHLFVGGHPESRTLDVDAERGLRSRSGHREAFHPGILLTQ